MHYIQILLGNYNKLVVVWSEMDLLGCPYPIVKTPLGLLPTVYEVDVIRADLIQLLLTNPGERVMLPAYGTALRKLVFEPNDATFPDRVRAAISQAIQLWEPRVVIKAINVITPQGNTGPAAIPYNYDTNSFYANIKFVLPDKIQAVQDLILQIPIGD